MRRESKNLDNSQTRKVTNFSKMGNAKLIEPNLWDKRNRLGNQLPNLRIKIKAYFDRLFLFNKLIFNSQF